MNILEEFEQIVSQLDKQKQIEVLDFAKFLMNKKAILQPKETKKIEFKWAGALAKHYPNITSVELQHQTWNDVINKYDK